MPFLRGRLDVAAELITTGKVRALLISGDAGGGSGDEVRVMREYLARKGVDPARMVVDPYGLDTYDTCRRAHDVYGVRKALLVSQELHLHRAVTRGRKRHGRRCGTGRPRIRPRRTTRCAPRCADPPTIGGFSACQRVLTCILDQVMRRSKIGFPR
jgi:vancomycin permeability regulator SanA